MVTCPYCFERVARERIAFRCAGRPGRGVGCEPELDERLAGYLGSAAAASLPPVFSVRRPGRRADCPRCGRSTGWRVCPECHNRLPAEYCAHPGKIVALVGAKGSGKSTYIAVLLHELTHRVGAELDASLIACDDRTIARYKQDFARPLYGQSRLLSTTQSAATEPRDPLVYLLTRTVRGRLRTRTESLTLVLFDTAGEDLRSREVTELHLRYLNAADAIVFLMDPLELAGATTALEGAARSGGGVNASDPDSDPMNVISRVTELLRARRGDRRIAVPVAVALSKIDTLRPGMERQSALHRARTASGSLDLDDQEAVHEQVRGLLDEWQAGMVDRYLRQHYSDFAFFGLSALGGVPDTESVGPGGIRPYRVEDPLLWLLHRFGMLGGHRARAGRGAGGA
jgi:GTPase SAR1 family protein